MLLNRSVLKTQDSVPTLLSTMPHYFPNQPGRHSLGAPRGSDSVLVMFCESAFIPLVSDSSE